METFKHLFLNACTQIHREPDKRLLSILDSSGINSSLNFSECSMSFEMCRALGLALAKDVHVTDISFSNCMLPDEGLTEILKGLMHNQSLITLDLMGNNIKSNGAVVLGKFLQRNSHLLRLNLDWNSLGILPEKFAVFCQGLIHNSTLKDLDLGHNQLNHMCASSLGEMIMKNSSLENLRLQFNSFGPIGGEQLLKALSYNKILIQLDVEGNNLGPTVERSLEITIKRNIEKKVVAQRHAEEARNLANKLQEVEHEKKLQIKVLTEALEKKKNEAFNEHKMNSMSISQLQDELYEKDAALEVLKSEYSHLKESLSRAEMKLDELLELSSRLKKENSSLITEHASILSQERKKHQDIQNQLQEEVVKCNEKLHSNEQEINDLRKDLSYHETLSHKLEKQVQDLTEQLKSSEVSFKEKMDDLKLRQSERLQEVEGLRQKDVTRLGEEHSKMEQHYTKRIQALEEQRMTIETEVSELKRALENEKQEKVVLLYQQQQKAKEDEVKLISQMEEKIELISESKKKKEKLLEEQSELIRQLQTKNTALSLELDQQVHQSQHLEQRLNGSEEECKVQIAKIKLEVKEDLEELRLVKEQNKELCDEISQLKKQLEDMTVSYSQQLKLKDLETEQKKQELLLQEKRIETLKEEEMKRATQLQAVVAAYVQDVQNQASKQS